MDPSLRFTVEIGGKSLKFMDLLIFLKNGVLYTTVYSKPTDGHLYLHNDSCHPLSTKLAVETGVALRLRLYFTLLYFAGPLRRAQHTETCIPIAPD